MSERPSATAAAEQSASVLIEPAPLASQLAPDVKLVKYSDGSAGGSGGGGGIKHIRQPLLVSEPSERHRMAPVGTIPVGLLRAWYSKPFTVSLSYPDSVLNAVACSQPTVSA